MKGLACLLSLLLEFTLLCAIIPDENLAYFVTRMPRL